MLLSFPVKTLDNRCNRIEYTLYIKLLFTHVMFEKPLKINRC